ncbi:MAG: DUF4350 domain-containing protein [Chloroflexi bacterium]|nr:DUF4350 domain-containing protein [Chloroflexota bacterium]
MKWPRILLAFVLLLLLPIVGRALWFYQGIYHRATPVATPDYNSFTMPFPTLSTPPALAKAEQPSGQVPQVLFDQVHGNLYTLSELDTLTQTLSELGSEVKADTGARALKEQLKSAAAYVVIAPTVPFSNEEIAAINQFVERGGHLLVIADPTREYGSDLLTGAASYDSVDASNPLLAAYNMAFVNDYVYNLVKNEGNFRNIYAQPASQTGVADKITSVVFYSVHSINAPQDQMVLESSSDSLSSKTDQGQNLALAAASPDGRVLAIGDMTFLTAPYNQVADNGLFIQNLARFLNAGERDANLLDFPYLFKRPVTLLLDQENSLDSDTLTLVSQIQQSLQALNVSMEIAEKPASGKDLILFGTFDDMDALGEYLTPFHLKYSGLALPTDLVADEPPPTEETTPTPEMALPSDEETGSLLDLLSSLGSSLEVPGVGQVDTEGTGLFLFSAKPEQNTLILLGNSNQELLGLAGLIAGGSLTDCITNETTAVCVFSTSIP